MFTGIVEGIGIVKQIKKESANLRLTIQAPFTHELKIDQSISHNGACLTVTNIHGDEYDVTVIEETLLIRLTALRARKEARACSKLFFSARPASPAYFLSKRARIFIVRSVPITLISNLDA